jgi:hypothetical protein
LEQGIYTPFTTFDAVMNKGLTKLVFDAETKGLQLLQSSSGRRDKKFRAGSSPTEKTRNENSF